MRVFHEKRKLLQINFFCIKNRENFLFASAVAFGGNKTEDLILDAYQRDEKAKEIESKVFFSTTARSLS